MNRIKELRTKNGMTQAELAEIIGINSVTLARYESGDRNPKIDKLEKMSKVFNVSIDYLSGREENYANNLKKLRKEHNFSQTELAEKIGVSDASINKYENGRMIPKIDKLEKMAEIFNVPVSYIMGYSNSKGENEIVISTQEYERLKGIEQKYNEIKSLVTD